MRLLLDTHAFLWAVGDPGVLDRDAREAIVDPANLVLVSAVTAWEIAIKRQVGKLEFDGSVLEHVLANRFTPLAATLVHAEGLAALPPLHSDPFDRLLIVQAQAEAATLVTRDAAVRRYDVATIPA